MQVIQNSNEVMTRWTFQTGPYIQSDMVILLRLDFSEANNSKGTRQTAEGTFIFGKSELQFE